MAASEPHVDQPWLGVTRSFLAIITEVSREYH